MMTALWLTSITAAATATGSTAGYQFFHEPMPIEKYWLLLVVPLVAVISIVYKTIKLKDLSQLPRQSLFLMTQILAFMMMAAAALWLLTELR